MGKREIKKQHKDIDLNIIDLLANLDPTEGNKFLPFFIKKLKSLNKSNRELKKAGNEPYSFNPLNTNNEIQNILSRVLLDIMGGNLSDLNKLNDFENHVKNKRIPNSDVGTYDNWNQIKMAVEVADIKLRGKELKATTEEIFKNDEWLIIRPLSFESSKAYGANTRWCTTMESEKSYFYRYSKGGLIYAINRVSGDKFGFYDGFFEDSLINELTVWDSVDNRIDSLSTNIPLEIMYLVKEALQTQNYDLFCDEVKNEYHKWVSEKKTMMTQLVDEPVPINIGNTVEDGWGNEDIEMDIEVPLNHGENYIN